jgi:nucleotide-binding universal stress UspA family protein
LVDSAYHDCFSSKHESTQRKFDSFLKAENLTGEWHVVESDHPSIMNATLTEAKKADLVVVGHAISLPVESEEKNVLERVVMETGRPILIIPAAGKIVTYGSSLCEKAIMGINGSRESSRAMFDAIPLLKDCEEVRVIWVDPYKHREEAGEVPGSDEATILSRHGINAVAEAMMADGREPAEALLMRAKDLGAGLIVIGAYGNSRLREYIFGGTTRYMLERLDVPVLMSH